MSLPQQSKAMLHRNRVFPDHATPIAGETENAGVSQSGTMAFQTNYLQILSLPNNRWSANSNIRAENTTYLSIIVIAFLIGLQASQWLVVLTLTQRQRDFILVIMGLTRLMLMAPSANK